jgi:hypothetical protein
MNMPLSIRPSSKDGMILNPSCPKALLWLCK